jgi:hypothetical protein
MKKVIELFKTPYRILSPIAARGYFKSVDDALYLSFVYRGKVGCPLNLSTPQTFTEKLQWLKLYDRKPEYTTMVDKYTVKKYVAARIGEQHVIPTLGVWNKFDEINFDALPDQFVLKCTHDSGGLVICRDKNKLDLIAAKRKINKSLKLNYYFCWREWPYKNVPPRIIAEKYMCSDSIKELTDYKFYCFNGVPQFLYLSTGLENHATARISFLTMDWQFAPYERSDFKPFDTLPPKPIGFGKMVEFCKILSKGHNFLRVDLYQIGDEVYFSELTFTPSGGFMPFKNPEHDLLIGKILHLPEKK